jgi:hypothetical protein
MIIEFINSSCSYSLLDYDGSEIDNSVPSNCSLNIFGNSIITRNMDILKSLYDIEKIVIPKKLNFLTSIINSSFKGNIVEVDKKNYDKLVKTDLANNIDKDNLINSYNGEGFNSEINSNQIQHSLVTNKTTLLLPCNVII